MMAPPKVVLTVRAAARRGVIAVSTHSDMSSVVVTTRRRRLSLSLVWLPWIGCDRPQIGRSGNGAATGNIGVGRVRIVRRVEDARWRYWPLNSLDR